MPEYALTLHFAAPDDATAAKRGEDIADLCAAEFGVRNPVVTRVDGELREAIRAALDAAPHMTVEDVLDTVMAVVAPELERLRARTAEAALDTTETQADRPTPVEAYVGIFPDGWTGGLDSVAWVRQQRGPIAPRGPESPQDGHQ